MTDADRPTTAEELNAKHLRQLVKISPSLNDEPSVSGRLIGVHHTIGNLVRVDVRVDEKNDVTLFLRPGVSIKFWHEPTR